MSRVRLVLIALGTAFALPALAGADVPPTKTPTPALTGTWRSAPEPTPLSSPFEFLSDRPPSRLASSRFFASAKLRNFTREPYFLFA